MKVDGWLSLLRALRGTRDRHRRGVQLDRRVASATPARPTTRPPTTCSARASRTCAGRAPDTRGVAIDWTAWAEHRHGEPRLDPEDDGDGRHRHAPARGRHPGRSGARSRPPATAARCWWPARSGVLTEERHPTGGLDPDAAGEKAAAAPGPMTGRIASMPLAQGLTVLTELDPSRQAFLDDHRIDGTPVLPGVMGMEGFAEAAHALLPGWHVSALEDVDLRAPFKFYRDEPRTLELRALLRRRRRRHDRGRLPADRAAHAARQGRAGDGALHRPRAPDAGAAARTARARAPERGGERRTRWTARPSTGSTSTAPPTRCSSGAWRADGDVVGRLAPDLPPGPRAAGPADGDRPAPDRALLPDRGRVGARHVRADGPAHARRPRGALRGRGRDSGALFAVVHPRGRRRASTPRWWTTSGRVRLRLEGYRTTALPGGLDPETLDPIRAAMD